MSLYAILQTHIVIVFLYGIFFLLKVILMFGKQESFIAFRNKTKILDMILPVLFLVSGVYLAAQINAWTQTWFMIKMVLLVAVIVTGVISFKKMNKGLAILSLLILISMFVISYMNAPV